MLNLNIRVFIDHNFTARCSKRLNERSRLHSELQTEGQKLKLNLLELKIFKRLHPHNLLNLFPRQESPSQTWRWIDLLGIGHAHLETKLNLEEHELKAEQ